MFVIAHSTLFLFAAFLLCCILLNLTPSNPLFVIILNIDYRFWATQYRPLEDDCPTWLNHYQVYTQQGRESEHVLVCKDWPEILLRARVEGRLVWEVDTSTESLLALSLVSQLAPFQRPFGRLKPWTVNSEGGERELGIASPS